VTVTFKVIVTWSLFHHRRFHRLDRRQVIRMGRALKIPTPSHEFIYANLLPMELKARGK